MASPDGLPIAGANVALDGLAPVRSDGSGNYALETIDATTKRLTVEASGFLTRETLLRGGEGRIVDLDLIASQGQFPLSLYRQMARDGHERPASLQPIARWTLNPNFHIRTTWRDSGRPINPSGLEYIIGEIRRVIPQLTGGRFQAGRIETGPETPPAVKDWIYIHFDNSGNWSYLGENPGFIQFGLDVPCTSIMVIHELGHAMGYYHSSARPSVMGGGVPANCDQVNLTADEQLVARVMYSRPVGNVEPDRDPSSFSYFVPGAVEPRVVRCGWLLPVRP